MTREQDFERRLAEWLGDGPATAPTEVVETAIDRVAGRPQRHRLWGWLPEMVAGMGMGDRPRAFGLLIALVLTLLTALVIALPIGGGTRPAPVMVATGALGITGTIDIVSESVVDGTVQRIVVVDASDPRVSGEGQQVLHLEDAPGTGMQHWSGFMRLDNEWGAWEGSFNGARFPDGSALEYGWLTGQGAYEDLSYFHSTRDQVDGTERVVEGVIWPGEPPAIPDPSLLP